MKTTKINTKNTILPGEVLSEKAFKALIKEAEAGPFLSEEEYQKEFNKWRKQLKK
jgi:hypothetical protein